MCPRVVVDKETRAQHGGGRLQTGGHERRGPMKRGFRNEALGINFIYLKVHSCLQ